MQTFKSLADLEQVTHHPARAAIELLLIPLLTTYPDYRPEDDGYVVLIEPADVDRVLSDLSVPHRLSEIPFEAVDRLHGHFHAFYLANNQFGLSFLIPDADWLPADLRHHLETHLDP